MFYEKKSFEKDCIYFTVKPKNYFDHKINYFIA